MILKRTKLNDNDALLLCFKLIVQKMGWGEPESWTNRHYTLLSDQFEQDTKISISVSSLRRLFANYEKKEISYNPQLETRNALAKFLNFKNWEHFRITAKKPFHLKKINFRFAFFVALIMVLAIGIFLILSNRNISSKEIYFSGKYLLSNQFPHSVLFNYDISSYRKKEIYIVFDDTFSREEDNRILLSHEKQTITHLYTLPDLYQVKLRDQGKTIKELNVHVVTDGWKSFVAYDSDRQYKPLLVDTIHRKKSVLSVSHFELNKSGIDTTKPFWIKYRNIRNFDADLDNFKLETKIKNVPNRYDRSCQQLSLYVLGENNRISIKFTNKGCFSANTLEIGENHINGKFTDLSSFALEIAEWNKVNINVANKSTTVFINDSLIFKGEYQISGGRIKGLLFDSKGIGMMEYCQLSDSTEKNIYREDF